MTNTLTKVQAAEHDMCTRAYLAGSRADSLLHLGLRDAATAILWCVETARVSGAVALAIDALDEHEANSLVRAFHRTGLHQFSCPRWLMRSIPTKGYLK